MFLQENLRAVVQEIISDSTGKNALEYINSRSDLLRSVARLVGKNIKNFNMPTDRDDILYIRIYI